MGGKSDTAGLGRDLAPIRLRDTLFRLVCSVFIGSAGVLALSDVRGPAIWFTAAVLVQIAVLALSGPARRDPRAAMPRWRRMACSAVLNVSALVFAASAPMFWFEGGWAAGLFALFMLAGATVHVIVRTAHAPRDLWIRAAPFLVLLQILPLFSFLTADTEDRGVMGVMVLAATLLVVRLLVAGWTCVGTARQARLALEEARRERRRAEAASAAKSEFLDLMGHELRTPLNGVLGMAQAMAGADLPAEQRRQLEVLRASGELLLTFVNDVLEFSQISPAEVELDAAIVEPHALAAEMQAVFAGPAEARGLRLEAVCLPSAGERRAGDPARVRQLMRNIMGLALRSVESGAISIVAEGDADELRFELTAAFLESSPLYGRLKASPHGGPAEGGVSVVLDVARDLALRMGGDLALIDRPGGLSTLVVRLALPFEAGGLQAIDAAAAIDPPLTGDTRLRVLAAEDNPTNQLVLKTLLEQAGLAVHIVGDGEEAVAAWREALWDVVLMDVRMPRMDGVAATRAIRALEAATGRSRTPILAVTADAMTHQAQEYARAGMDGVVPKPIQFAELAARVVAAAAEGRSQLEAERVAV